MLALQRQRENNRQRSAEFQHHELRSMSQRQQQKHEDEETTNENSQPTNRHDDDDDDACATTTAAVSEVATAVSNELICGLQGEGLNNQQRSLGQLKSLAEELKAHQPSKYAFTFLITGSNSGIGLIAAKLLLLINPLNRLILAARTMEKALWACDQVKSVFKDPMDRQRYGVHVLPLVCDQCSLQSVRESVVQLRRSLTETYSTSKWQHNGIDALCLNAAVLTSSKDCEAQYTDDDGHELTFQTNHLGPFLLVQLTRHLLNPGGRVILTTSGLHVGRKLCLDGMIDKNVETQLQESEYKKKKARRRHDDQEDDDGSDDPRMFTIPRKSFDMIDDQPYHYKHSYALSKLCNVATCIELNKKLEAKGCVANCFTPGLMTRSGLFRHQEGVVKHGTQPIQHQVSDSSTSPSMSLTHQEKTVEWGAGALVFMATADETGPSFSRATTALISSTGDSDRPSSISSSNRFGGGQYWRDVNPTLGTASAYGKEFCGTPINQDMISHNRSKELWSLSCQLVGLPCDY